MPTMTRTAIAPDPLIPSTALPAWATVALDGALGAGVLRGDELEGLDSDALLRLSQALVRASLGSVDASRVAKALAEARKED